MWCKKKSLNRLERYTPQDYFNDREEMIEIELKEYRNKLEKKYDYGSINTNKKEK